MNLEYDSFVRRLNPATVAVFAAILALSLGTPHLVAQINGTPASVTSIGFGGQNTIRGTPASVTSLGPNGLQPKTPFFTQSATNPFFPARTNPPVFTHRRHHHEDFFPVAGAVYAVPYPVAVEPAMDATDDAEGDDRGGPTIFDRRGPGRTAEADRYVARRDQPEAAPAREAEGQAASPDQPQTVLVFKDGHQLEVQNYAVVGNDLYDLTPGHRRKIGLSELDLTATVKENDDRGIDFRLSANP